MSAAQVEELLDTESMEEGEEYQTISEFRRYANVQTLRQCVDKCLSIIPAWFILLHKFVQAEITIQVCSVSSLALLFDTYGPGIAAKKWAGTSWVQA